MPVIPSLLEGMAYLSAPDEAVRLCEKMNYRDSMIHIAEPFARWTIQCAPDALPFSGENIAFTDDLAPAIQKKQALFDGGLFAFAALGALHGNRTLADCMRDKPLRDLAGRAIYDEILPFVSIPRDEAAEYVIQSCERWENPLIENRIFDAAAGMLSRFREGVLPIMKRTATKNSKAPERPFARAGGNDFALCRRALGERRVSNRKSAAKRSFCAMIRKRFCRSRGCRRICPRNRSPMPALRIARCGAWICASWTGWKWRFAGISKW